MLGSKAKFLPLVGSATFLLVSTPAWAHPFHYPSYTPANIVPTFVAQGIWHILTGYDHILFLLSVVLLLTSVKRVLAVITAFTVAHSVTLTLAALHVVSVPANIVEPLIALTIIVVALRNLWILRSKRRQPERLAGLWLTAAGFGLIHGLAFASGLIPSYIPPNLFVPALISFNVGVEIGQLAILLITVPVLLWLHRRPEQKLILRATCVAIIAVAAYWLFMRQLAFVY